MLSNWARPQDNASTQLPSALKRSHLHGRHSRQFPIGMRTLKTVLAVLLSTLLMKYVLHQNPFFACIGAVVVMERTLDASMQAAIVRNVGTIAGGLLGIAIGSITENILVLSLGLIPLIWLSIRVGKHQSIVPGAIVYFAVFFLNTMDQAWHYSLVRIFGTLVGTLIAILVNITIQPPRAPSDPAPESPAPPATPA